MQSCVGGMTPILARGQDMRQIVAAVAVVSLLFSGCASMGNYGAAGRTIGHGFLGGGPLSSRDQDEIVKEELQTTFKVCKKQLSEMEGNSYTQRKTSLWVYGAGLIAGSVIAPGLAAANAAKHAGAIAGLAGLAGASGLAGRALEQTALDGSAMAKDRNEVAATIRRETASAMTPGELGDRLAAVRRMEAACIAYNITVPGGLTEKSALSNQ